MGKGISRKTSLLIVYDTMWEGTTKIAHAIAPSMRVPSSPDTVVKVFNISKADKNEIMTEVFKSAPLLWVHQQSATVFCAVWQAGCIF